MKTKAVCRLIPAHFLTLLLAATAATFWAMPVTAHGQMYVMSSAGAGTSIIGEYNLDGTVVNPALVSGSGFTFAVSGTDLFVLSEVYDPVNQTLDGTLSQYALSGTTATAVNPSVIPGLTSVDGFVPTLAVSGANIFIISSGQSLVGTIGEYSLTSGLTVNASVVTGLNQPQAMIVSGANLFVTSGGSDGAGTIGEYTLAGDPVNPALVTGLPIPEGLAISGTNLFVTCFSQNSQVGSVDEYAVTGTTATAVSAPLISQSDNTFMVNGIAVSGTNLFLINDAQTGVVGEYGTGGATENAALIPTFAGGANFPVAIVIPQPLPPVTAQIFISNFGLSANHNTGAIGEYTVAGGVVSTVSDSAILDSPAPEVLAVSGSNLFAMNQEAGTVDLYTVSGTNVTLVTPSLINGLTLLTSIAVSGTLIYVGSNPTDATGAATVSAYNTSGLLVNPSVVTGLPNSPGGIAVSGTTLFVSYYVSEGAPGIVGEYSTSGTVLNASLISNLGAPGAMAISGNNLFVTDYLAEGMNKYLISGTNAIPVSVPLVSYYPGGLAVSGTDLYITDSSSHYAFEITTDGAMVNPSLASGYWLGPTGIAVMTPQSAEQAQLSISVNLTSTSDTTSGLITHIGDDLTYTFTWINSGNDTAMNLIVETPVPTYIDATSGLPLQFPQTDLVFNQYGTYIPPTSSTSNDAAVMWQVANLVPGYEQSVGLTIHVGAEVQTGQVLGILNTYQVYSTTNQPSTAATGAGSGSPDVGSTVVAAATTIHTPVLTKIVPGAGKNPWKFTVTEPGSAGTSIQLQYSINGTVWVDLASTEKQAGNVFTLTATGVPANAAFFQVIAQQGGSSSQPSNDESLYAVDATIADVSQTDPVKTTVPIGKGIINIDSKQTLTLHVDRNATGIFAIHVDNNSRFPDSITFTGGQNSSFFTAQFFAQAGTAAHPTIGPDITQAVFAGTFKPSFPSTAGFTVYLKVLVSDLAPIGWSGNFTMEMASAADPNVSDFVIGVVDVTQPKRTVYVTNTNDSGPNSLRAAITFANANKDTTIDFAIPTTDPGFTEVTGGQQFIITPATLLPPITGHGTILDGSSQTNATGYSNTAGPSVAIVGPGADPSTQHNSFLYGLAIGSSLCEVKSLEIDKCYAGIGIAGPKTAENTIQGCQFIGDANSGVSISFGAHDNTIGGTVPGQGNTFLPLATEPTLSGITIDGANANLIYGNTIGNLTNGGQANSISLIAGVQVSGGAQGNYIGGVSAGMGNVISGNLFTTIFAAVGEGVWITDAGTNSNFVLGNRIGTAANGNSAVPNLVGVKISDGASGNYIGSSVSGGGNTISGNAFEGVEIESGTTTGNVIAGNYIGTNPVGNGAIPNMSSAVLVSYAGGGNIIGGKKPADRNIISGNSVEGIRINSSNDTIVQNNLIGTAFNGTSPIPNGTTGAYNGIILNNASGTSMTGNTIAFNTSDGIEVADPGNTIRQNSIFDNGNLGIELDDPSIQISPNLTNAYVNGTKTFITGDISGAPKTVYYIDFYQDIALDNLGSGEGAAFIGSGTLTTDASGNASFNFSFPKAYAGSYATATITGKADASTSEFSNTLLVAPTP